MNALEKSSLSNRNLTRLIDRAQNREWNTQTYTRPWDYWTKERSNLSQKTDERCHRELKLESKFVPIRLERMWTRIESFFFSFYWAQQSKQQRKQLQLAKRRKEKKQSEKPKKNWRIEEKKKEICLFFFIRFFNKRKKFFASLLLL